VGKGGIGRLAVLVLGLGLCACTDEPAAPSAKVTQPTPAKPARFVFNDGANQELPLSAKFSAHLRALRASRGQAWHGTGGLTAAPLGFFRFDGEELAYYGFMTSETRSWQDPVLRRFWKVVTTQPPAALSTFSP
jgi:hypothetical protein